MTRAAGGPGQPAAARGRAPPPAAAPARHPLAPLTAAETAAAARLALDACPGARLVYCALEEPPRETVLGWDGGAVPRRVRCVLYERPAG